MKQLLTINIVTKQKLALAVVGLSAVLGFSFFGAPSAKALDAVESKNGVSGKVTPQANDPNAVGSKEANTAAVDPIIKCGPNSPADKDGSAWGRYFRYNNTVLYREPRINSTRCALGQKTHVLDYHCFVISNDGYSWTYVRDATTHYAGWVRDPLFTNYGSFVRC